MFSVRILDYIHVCGLFSRDRRSSVDFKPDKHTVIGPPLANSRFIDDREFDVIDLNWANYNFSYNWSIT